MTVDRGASLLDCPVTEFLDRLAAKQPTPGGGGAAAITAAIAAGLLAMAARYSTAQLADAASRAAHADHIRTQVAALAEQDAHAYQAVLAAFALPRQPNPQARRQQIQHSLQHAAQIPAQIAEIANNIATEATEIAKKGNSNLRGDAFAAATLAAAAARAAAELVRLNVQLGNLSGDLAERAAQAADTAARAVVAMGSS